MPEQETPLHETVESRKPRRSLSRAAKILGGAVLASAIGLGSQGTDNDTNLISADLPPSSTPLPGSEIPQGLKDIVTPQLSEEERQRTAELKDGIANKYGIYIQTFDEISKAPVAKYMYSFGNLFNQNQEWNKTNLSLLEQAISNVPKDFYEPKKGEQVHIILGPTSVCGLDLKTFTPFYPREIMLSYSYFSPENPLTANWVFVHEGVHLKTMDSCSTSETNPPRSPYFGKLDKVLGMEYQEAREMVLRRLDELKETGAEIKKGGAAGSLESILTPQEEETFRLTRMNYGVSKDLPTEFLAVAGESYFLGKEYFYKMYSPFFSVKTVDRLYKFMKDDIFEGKEYPAYQLRLTNMKSVNKDGSYNYGNGVIGPSSKDREEANNKR